MKKVYSKSRKGLLVAFALLFMIASNRSYAQIVSYVDDTLGALNLVAANATGTALARVNGASLPTFICNSGFSSKSYTTATSYSSSLPAVEVTVTPNTGHTLNISGFSADLRRSNTGPSLAHFAYSTDGGTTWTDQGVDQTPNHSGCDTFLTCAWETALTVAAPNTLQFRVFGLAASGTSGTFQIKNLLINGSVTPPVSIKDMNKEKFEINVNPNPVASNSIVSYKLNSTESVSIKMFNLIGQQVATIIDNSTQKPGVYSFPISIATPGIYFIRCNIGNEIVTKRIEKQ